MRDTHAGIRREKRLRRRDYFEKDDPAGALACAENQSRRHFLIAEKNDNVDARGRREGTRLEGGGRERRRRSSRSLDRRLSLLFCPSPPLADDCIIIIREMIHGDTNADRDHREAKQ